MAKKESIPVVVDSNAFYAAGPTLGSPQFVQTWKECLQIAPLKLFVPDVVRGERIYQLVRIANEAVQNAKKNFNSIHTTCGREKPALPSYEELKKEVEEHFGKWLKNIDAIVVPTPYDKIDWGKMANDAVWRIAPFTPSDKEGTEKGFRDALVLETLAAIVLAGTKTQVVFVCNDDALGEAASLRLGEKIIIHKQISAFASNLKLEQENHNKKLTQLILQRAAETFYRAEDSSCIYSNFKIYDRIQKEFSAQLDILIEPPPMSLVAVEGISALGRSPIVYLPTSEDKVFIDATDFRKVENGRFQFTSLVRFIRVFKRQTAYLTNQDNLFFQSIRIQPFAVSWSAAMKDEANLEGVSVDGIAPLKKSVQPATLNAMVQYGFLNVPGFTTNDPWGNPPALDPFGQVIPPGNDLSKMTWG